ncbi:OmpA family protein [Chitinophagaceae bacterium 26-R-25]|nr:OmpA family protein [Chitinophagaceae bacterium 26-R-25]
MKKTLSLIAALLLVHCLSAQVQDPSVTAKQGATDKVNNTTSDKVNKGLDKTEDAVKGMFKKKKDNKPTAVSDTTPATSSASGSTATAATLSTYQNYDFVPGDKILFEDHFTDDADGEFPAHWELLKGQGVLNKMAGDEAFTLTDGNYVKVAPRMQHPNYLTDPFTVEYDTYAPGGSYGLLVFLNAAGTTNDQDATVQVSEAEANFSSDAVSLTGALPASIKDENFINKWHHIAIAYKNKQVKVYVDQFRVLTIPDAHMIPAQVQFGGIASQENPMVFKNVKIAAGGDMNMIGKQFTASKIVTHGINFDIDKATIRPESMGTLNMIVQVMTSNPAIKFEVDGHTDNSGSSAHNATLSQQRADAVKQELVKLGIDQGRLTTKGFGDTKPISDNNSPEGKANNRRVEFVKM